MLNKTLKILLSILLLFSFSFSVFAKTYTNDQIDKLYDRFIQKIERKYSKDKEKKLLHKVDTKLKYILDHKKLSTTNKLLIKRLIYLNRNYLSKLESNDSFVKKSSVITTTKTSKIDNSSQIKTENRIYNFLKKQSESFKKANYIEELIKSGKNFYFTNKNFEYVKNNDIFKLDFSNYYKINLSNYNQFKNKAGIIVYSESIGYALVNNYYTEKKIRYSEASKELLGTISDEKRYILEGDTYYFYKFVNYSHISDVYGFYLSELNNFGFKPSKTLLYKDAKNKFNFVYDYKKIKLINKTKIKNIGNKDLFLNILSDDKYYVNINYDKTLDEIKKISIKITSGKTRNEKIKVIYDWVLDNISYKKNYNLSDNQIFSGLETYKNKTGVCDGYVKLTIYMLLFAGINDVEYIDGYVIDALDFPQIGHAWLKIGDKYYDPTFDDPIGAKTTRKYSEYKYFALPKDLFYANRYDYGKLPEYIKKLNLEKRKEIIFNNLAKLVDKYKGKNYLLLKPFEFRKKYNLGFKDKLKVTDLRGIIKYYYVNDYVFYDEKGTRKYILSIEYYTINDDNIETILEDVYNYNLDGLYLFKWQDENGNITYRLTNNVVIK